jgi:hypothetical protein
MVGRKTWRAEDVAALSRIAPVLSRSADVVRHVANEEGVLATIPVVSEAKPRAAGQTGADYRL